MIKQYKLELRTSKETAHHIQPSLQAVKRWTAWVDMPLDMVLESREVFSHWLEL